MKILSIIFCFMVFSQAFTACMDNAITTKSSVVIFNKNNHEWPVERHAEKDLCSPFCQCACCATPTVAAVMYSLIHLCLISETPFNEPPSQGFLEISLSVWQPPKLV